MPMSSTIPVRPGRAARAVRRLLATLSSLPALAFTGTVMAGSIELADRPPRTSQQVPANVMLALSVEWPTGNVQAYNDEIANGCLGRENRLSVCYMEPVRRAQAFNTANQGNPNWRARASMPYLGYFDPWTCYRYDTASGQFVPSSRSTAFDASKGSEQTYAPRCTSISTMPDGRRGTRAATNAEALAGGTWSGNFLNWATMQTIDLFRWAMTGGDRVVDTTTLTVLEKARHDGQGDRDQFPIKRIHGNARYGDIVPADVSPFGGWSNLYLRVDFQPRDPNTPGPATISVSSSADFSAATTLTLQARVQVCARSAALVPPETATTCTAYKAGGPDADGNGVVDPDAILKPTGLIQANAMAVRFGAFGYLLDDDWRRDGGVLRARMKFVGPQQPARSASGVLANAAREWDPATGIYVANPDPADATTTNAAHGLSGGAQVSRSGVIQYLNRFGRANGYKNYDPVSEMYYEALRYYRALDPTVDAVRMGATGGTADRKVDGFPVITSWDDPLAPPAGFASPTLDEWCPKNFIIGIADSNAHKDKRLPGNTSTVNEVAATPSYASGADTAVNVNLWLTKLIGDERRNEGVTLLNASGGNLAAGPVNCCDGSAYVAALAYWANVSDIRPDGAALQTKGKQTVQSFFVDVRENGSWGTGVARGDVRRRNQLWLAAKYGGFNDLNAPLDHTRPGELDNDDATSNDNRDGVIDVRDAWDRDGDLLPDTYYEAGTPEALVDGLKNAFQTIRARAASAAGVSVSTRAVELTTQDGIYRVSYDPRNWAGSVSGLRYRSVSAESESIETDPVWDAAERLAGQDWSTGRRIVTRRTDTGAAVPFRWANLASAQQAALGSASVLEWLRGRADDPTLRTRTRIDERGRVFPGVLGDVVDAEPRYVGPPSAPLAEASNPGYQEFRRLRAGREPMLYVGANDGMLHGFSADVTAGTTRGGTELFAYVPSFLYAGVTAPDTDGLRALSRIAYEHRYYVNGTPASADVDFNRTYGSGGDPTRPGYVPDWRTVLVGGLGKGGRGFFALDVTDPTAMAASESAAAGRVLWEFTDPDMGFSYGLPQIVKTRRWGWVALLTSGLNPVRAPSGGTAFLYVLDVKTGALLQKIGVPTVTGSPTDSSGLVQVTAYVPDATDGTVTEVYGGDQNGNVWRFDFTSATASVPTPVLFAQARDAAGVAQPISTGPMVRVAPLTGNRYVFLGTGRLYGVSDLFDDRVQTFYAFRDGSRSKVWTAGDRPAAVTLPLGRDELVAQRDLTRDIAPDAARPAGWFHDLSAAGERVIVDPQDTDFGKVSWLGSIPDSNNPCVPTGGSRIYATSFETGRSQLFRQEDLLSGSPSPARVAYLDPRTGAVGLRLVRVDGNIRAVVTGQYNELRLTQGYFRYRSPRSLNWREITEPGR